MKTMKY